MKLKNLLRKVLDFSDTVAPQVRNDLGKRLNQLQTDLGDQAVNYVLRGEDETVLASLTALGDKANLEVGANWVRDPATQARRKLLSQAKADVAFHTRYAQVLGLCMPATSTDAAGTTHVPTALRALFSEVFAGFHEMTNTWPKRAPKRDQVTFTPEHALLVIEALEGSATDFFDLAYSGTDSWMSLTGNLFRETFDLQDVVKANATAFVEAVGRSPAKVRAQMVSELAKWQFVGQEPFTECVLDQAGASAKSAREAALSALKTADGETLEAGATERLTNGNVAMRAGMVDLLGSIGSETALKTLETHLKTEKAARVLSQINNRLMVQAHVSEDSALDSGQGYIALDGSQVDVPDLKPLDATGFKPLGSQDSRELSGLIDAQNDRIKAANKERSGQFHYKQPLLSVKSITKHALAAFNVPGKGYSGDAARFLNYDAAGKTWASARLKQMPQRQALCTSIWISRVTDSFFPYYHATVFGAHINAFLQGEEGDLRHIENIGVEQGVEIRLGDWRKTITRPMETGDLLRFLLADQYWTPDLDAFPLDALWPLVAENFDVLDEAFGLAPASVATLERTAAVRILNVLPKTPMRFMAPLLEIATGTTKSGRAEARTLLTDAPGVTDRLIQLLSDSRQDLRAGAAEWLAARGDVAAVPDLKKRLKTEKSDLARAAILTALDRMGQDLSDYLGPKALLDEAVKGLTKVKFDKLDWLHLTEIPKTTYKSGRGVPDEVLKWWIFLAFKLKQPGGNALFDIYLDQLSPDSSEAFSTWLLENWLTFDTARPDPDEARKYAQQHAQGRYQAYKKWIEGFTLEQAETDLYREYMSNYPNSGTAAKGLLGLARKAPPTLVADRVRAYLKDHGSRTSQASSLLEMAAGMGDPVSLQVVIMAATRLKQKSVQKLAGELIDRVAEARGWTMDELSDRTIPVAGLNDDGILELPCGDRLFTARLDDDFKLQVRNPEGKTVKALPAAQDDATKASKKQLSVSKKELKQIVQMQSMRLYEALCAERKWQYADWHRDFQDHPVMKRLTEQVVWLGINGDKVTPFRPTPEGDYTDAEDGPVNPSSFPTIRLAHSALVEDDQAWIEHLKDYEVKLLFPQIGRALLSPDESQKTGLEITDRKGWVTDTFTIRGAASKLGYERGETLDGGYFCEYVKTFRSAGLKAVIEFSGNCLPEENLPAALIKLSFVAEGRGGTLRLDKVPPVLLSECWNDYRDMAAKAAFEPDWEKKMPW